MMEQIPIAYLIKVVLILALTAGVNFFVRRLLVRLNSLPKVSDWIKTLIGSLQGLSGIFIWGYGLLLAANLTASQFGFALFSKWIAQSRVLFIVVMGTWLLLKWKERLEYIIVKKGKGEQSLVTSISRLISIILLIVSGLVILEIFDYTPTALVAFGGLGGLAVSWAAKDVIANFFGGLMIHLNRHFTIGDWIRSPNKNFEGFVEEIGWYMTRVRTMDRRPMFIPNALITDAIIENPGRMYHRRIRFTVGVRYKDINVLKPIAYEIKKMLQGRSDVAQNQILAVEFSDFGPYSLELDIYAFTYKTKLLEYRTVRQDVLFKVAEIIASHGAQIAYPTSTVHLEKDITS